MSALHSGPVMSRFWAMPNHDTSTTPSALQSGGCHDPL